MFTENMIPKQNYTWLIDNFTKIKPLNFQTVQKRDFIHVDEIVKLIDEVLCKRDKFNLIY